MARLSWSLIVLAIWVVTGMSFFSETTVVYGQAAGCNGDVQGLITHCAVYVQKGTPMADPSAACCGAVKTVDIPCVCKNITKEIENLVDMNKVFHLASACGRPLPHGTKCGSKSFVDTSYDLS
ncbi:Bifunctional inhibitor/plant lipid transfer protein/seed storage helical domain containing protein [Parasponia andersonii]|uniref:Bifunctional inhibitor/plant lipid transfer protein/seed storage helical domain containing protein n=1 Tax=Parasponia andersonii TaxID=3476 RepID=A0A2P5DM62_PARAD|nr:Bifunctional inhibitor/plant lipid transfer protein/seed storage helical domain containing protein [Parasponia andersonii]